MLTANGYKPCCSTGQYVYPTMLAAIPHTSPAAESLQIGYNLRQKFNGRLSMV
jgi:hypothetical protein